MKNLAIQLRGVVTEAVVDKQTEKMLNDWATQAFSLLRRPGDSPAALSSNVAVTVGMQAARENLSKDVLKSWLQTAYGRIWVRLSNLNPGLDLRDISKILINPRSKHKPKS